MISKAEDYKLGDEEAFAVIHKESLNVGLLATLTVSTLQAYYSRLAAQKNTKILVVRDNSGNVIGYCVIQIGVSSLKSFLSLRLVFGLFLSLLKKPGFSRLIIQNDSFRKRGELNTAEILVLCVEERFRGKGIGNSLIYSTLEWCKENNVHSLFTTTHNNRLCDFYLRNYGAILISKTNFGFYEASKLKIY